MLLGYIMVAVGGAIGTLARYWFAAFMVTLVGPSFPWGTLIINIVGSFAIGVFATWTQPGAIFHMSHQMALFTMVGLCGGFTTFSSFSLQTLDLMRGKQVLHAIGYVVSSVVFCLVGVWVGTQL